MLGGLLPGLREQFVVSAGEWEGPGLGDAGK